jgi:hypothetical protein
MVHPAGFSNAVQASVAKVKGSKSVLVVGGGPVGVEAAAEILTDLPAVKVNARSEAHHGGQCHRSVFVERAHGLNSKVWCWQESQKRSISFRGEQSNSANITGVGSHAWPPNMAPLSYRAF